MMEYMSDKKTEDDETVRGGVRRHAPPATMLPKLGAKPTRDPVELRGQQVAQWSAADQAAAKPTVCHHCCHH